MGSHKRKRHRLWSLTKWALAVSLLANTSTFLQNSSQIMSSLYDMLVPKERPVTYAQVEALRVHSRWPTEDLPPTTDRVEVKVNRGKHAGITR